ncbi:Uncharacterised protein [Candidatus Gugararchaeum adminiculabundum]|nr:Uncharacterised protein [Candidatus Gugararchaeum adminiculabundum]
MSDDEISFAAKVGDWISIKKMSVYPNTTQPEVAGILAGIMATLTRKSFQYAQVDADAVDAIAARVTKGKRKGYKNIVDIFSAMKQGEIQSELEKCVVKPELRNVAESFFLRRVLENLGYSVDVNVDDIMSAYPELKIPKPKGNFGGKKKKKPE